MKSIGVTSSSFANSKYLRECLEAIAKQAGWQVSWGPPNLKDAVELLRFCRGHEALLVGREVFDRELLAHLIELKAMIVYGVGTDNIDLEMLGKMGVHFYWQGGVNAWSVAEHTIGLMIAMLRRINLSNIGMRRGHWIKNGGTTLKDKVLGIIGCGSIGSELIPLAQAFGMNVQICDIEDKRQICQKFKIQQRSFVQLMSTSDIISLHLPLSQGSKGLIDKSAISMMKPGSYIINTSRGEVWDLSAVLSALEGGRLQGAAADVFSTEPFNDLQVLGHPLFIATPHIAGNCTESVEAMGEAALRGFQSFLDLGSS